MTAVVTGTNRAGLLPVSTLAVTPAGSAGIGLALRPDVTFLDSEHLVAYAVGVLLASARVRERLTRPAKRLVLATAGVVLATRGP